MKNIVYSLFVCAALLLVGTSAGAQDNNRDPRHQNGAQMAQQWQERLESEKIAFLTNEMSLTPKEAQAFWPVYNQAQKEQREAVETSFKAFGELDKAIREGKTGKDIEALLKKYTEAVGLREASTSKYLKEYLKILSSEKVAKLYLGEERFRQSQIHRLRQPGMGPGQPPQQQPQGGWQPWNRKKDTDNK